MDLCTCVLRTFVEANPFNAIINVFCNVLRAINKAIVRHDRFLLATRSFQLIRFRNFLGS